MTQAIEALQADFQIYFLDKSSPRFHLLLAPVGTGKAYTAAQILSTLFQDKPHALVLVLAPRVLGPHWVDRLSTKSPKLPIIFVDRRKLVELQADAGPSDSPWPDRGIVVVGTEFALQEDVTDALAEGRWDLIVYDEAHQRGEQRNRLLRRLLDGRIQPRLLLLSSLRIPIDKELSALVAVTDWTRQLEMPRRAVSTLEFTRSESEETFFSHLRAYVARWRTKSISDIGTKMLARAAQSSPPALERMLDRSASRNVSDPTGESIEADAEEVLSDAAYFPQITAEEQHELQSLLDELDGLDIDSRLTTLQRWITDLRSREPERPICIYSRFVATVRYLETAVRDQHPEVVAVTGEMTSGERRLRLESFQNSQDILVTSMVALEGFEIHAGAVVFYDAPWSADAMAAALARIRCAEAEALEVVVLRDNSDTLRELDGEAAISR